MFVEFNFYFTYGTLLYGRISIFERESLSLTIDKLFFWVRLSQVLGSLVPIFRSFYLNAVNISSFLINSGCIIFSIAKDFYWIFCTKSEMSFSSCPIANRRILSQVDMLQIAISCSDEGSKVAWWMATVGEFLVKLKACFKVFLHSLWYFSMINFGQNES